MQTINSAAELKNVIQQLEVEREDQKQLLKKQFYIAYENLKPVNLIKSTLNNITSSPYLKDNLLASVLGLFSGYLSKKIVTGSSDNPVRKLLGTVLQVGVTNLIVQHPGTVKLLGRLIVQYIFHKNKTNPR